MHPYHNSLGLDKTTFFNGYGEMMGDSSNLGFNNHSHNLYLSGNE